MLKILTHKSLIPRNCHSKTQELFNLYPPIYRLKKTQKSIEIVFNMWYNENMYKIHTFLAEKRNKI